MMSFKYLILLALIATSSCIDFENPMRKLIGYNNQETSYKKSDLSPSGFLRNLKYSNKVYKGSKGSYTVIKMLGNGSSGTVYLAVDGLGKKYALKFPNDWRFYESLQKEEEILLQIKSGFTSQFFKNMYGLLYDIVDKGDYKVLVFKYYEYELQYIFNCKHFNNNMKLHVIGNVINSLFHLHRIGFGHFDLKVENIMMNNSGGAILIDFGFAKKATFTSGTTILEGSPLFMAPEIFERKDHGYSVDMWSFAMFVYDMFMDNPMIIAYTKDEVYKEILTTNFKEKLLELPKELFEVIPLEMLLKMLDIDPAKRTTSEEVYTHVFLENKSTLKIPFLYSELKRNKFDSFSDLMNKCISEKELVKLF